MLKVLIDRVAVRVLAKSVRRVRQLQVTVFLLEQELADLERRA